MRLPSIDLTGTDHSISRVGLGGMLLSIAGRPDRAAAKSVIRHAVERGITLIDTADTYALDHNDLGHNERLIGEALAEMGIDKGADSPVIVATKGGMTRPDGAWGRNGRPEHLREACHASLRALGTSRIALYQLHAPDPDVPFPDSVGAVARLREEGKIDAVGLSNVTVDQIHEAESIVPITSVQNRISPWDLEERRTEVLDHCVDAGIVFLAYAPLGGRRRAKELDAHGPLRPISEELEASPQELALAWLLDRAPRVVPIPGATRRASVDSTLRALSLDIDPDTRERLRKAFARLPRPPRPSLLGRVVRKLARAVRG